MSDSLQVEGLGPWSGATGDRWTRLRPLAHDGRSLDELPELVALDVSLAAGTVGYVPVNRVIALWIPGTRNVLPLAFDGLPVLEESRPGNDPPSIDDSGAELRLPVIGQLVLVLTGALDPQAFADWSTTLPWLRIGAFPSRGNGGTGCDWTDDPGEEN